MKKKRNNIKILSLLIIGLLCILTIGFSAFSADMIVNDMIAYIRPITDVRITRVALDSSNSSGYTSNSFDYDVSNITGSFVLDSIGSRITYEVYVTVYGSTEMAIKSVSVGENGSGLTASVTDYTLKTKVCVNSDSSKCSLNATRKMYVTIERTSGNITNYSNVRIDFDFKEVLNITYSNMSNTGYPSTILKGDDMAITFSNNSTYNGTATYVYNTNTLTVNSYTSTMPNGFTVTGSNTANSYSNNVLSITNITSDITITKTAASTLTAAETILALANGYSDTSTNVIGLGTDTSGCTKTLAYDGTTDKNLRYVGADPCNYVKFNCDSSGNNCEIWRIMGVMKGIDTNPVLKLVKNDNTLSTALHNSNINVWENTDFYTTLNTTYVNSFNNGVISNYVLSVQWYIGAAAYNSSATTAYTNEKSAVGSASYIGLISASDYYFATAGSNDSTRSSCLTSNMSQAATACYQYNYLTIYDGSQSKNQWTLTKNDKQTYILYISNVGRAVRGQTKQVYYYRPALYLKSNIKFGSGNGTSGTPYELTQ